MNYLTEIRAQQEANKGLSQEEKQALRRAKKAAKKGKQAPNEESAASATPAAAIPSSEAPAAAAPSSPALTKEGRSVPALLLLSDPRSARSEQKPQPRREASAASRQEGRQERPLSLLSARYVPSPPSTPAPSSNPQSQPSSKPNPQPSSKPKPQSQSQSQPSTSAPPSEDQLVVVSTFPCSPEPPFLRARALFFFFFFFVLAAAALRFLRSARVLAARPPSLLRPARSPHEQPRDHRGFAPRRRAARRLPALHRRFPHRAPGLRRVRGLPRGTADRSRGAELPDAAEQVAVAAVRVDLRGARAVGSDEAGLRRNPRNDQRDRPRNRPRARQGADPEESERSEEREGGETGSL